ncbi:hypothetical protein Halar_1563 [halophilic archaeon DL31]|jgi:hypothetical protein|nr:hypothetical protein Halar_1563 [halophilic archaeon DL31]
MPTEGDDGDDKEPDWQMAPDSESTFPEHKEKRELLREVAEEIRARDESAEASQVAAFLYRVSDLYKPGEETSPAEIYLNMRHIMEIKAQGDIMEIKAQGDIMEIKAQGGLNRGREE